MRKAIKSKLFSERFKTFELNEEGKIFSKLLSLKTKEERELFLGTLSEKTLRSMTKICVYVLLKSGVTLTKMTKVVASEVYLTPEIKSFVDSVRVEVEKAGEITKKSVSNAVDAVSAICTTAVMIGMISLTVFLCLNPPALFAVVGITTALSMLELIVKLFSAGGSSR